MVESIREGKTPASPERSGEERSVRGRKGSVQDSREGTKLRWGVGGVEWVGGG